MKVSIISLIYQSPSLADWVYGSVHQFTPMIGRGEAEFFFVANDPAPALLQHLQQSAYPHVVNINERYTDDELFSLGYGAPEYMSRVYRGYNEGIRAAKGDYVLLINSDNYFSPDWVENLLKYSDRSRVISSTLVERNHPQFSVFPGAIHGEFGGTSDSFDESGFLAFAARLKKTGLQQGGAYMPALFHRDILVEAGLYPSGNIAGVAFDEVVKYGDEALFERLASLGVSHFTALDSISYHLKEGERADPAAVGGRVAAQSPNGSGSVLTEATPARPYPIESALERVSDSMAPTRRHDALMMLLVDRDVEDPATRTLRQLLAAGVLTDEHTKRAKAELTRKWLERTFGKRASRPLIFILRAGVRFTRRVRRAVLHRGHR